MIVDGAAGGDDAGFVMAGAAAACRVEGDNDTGEVDAAERDGADPVARDPRPLPDAAFKGTGLLLVEGPPDAFTDAFADAGEVFGVVPLGSKRFAGGASQWVVLCHGEGGEVEDSPFVALGFQKAAGEVVGVPSGIDDDQAAVGFEAGEGDGLPPVPDPVALGLGLCVVGSLEGVIDYEAVVDEYTVSKEVAVAFHLDVMDSDARRVYSANHGYGVTADLWCTAWQV
nr:hypothetical protein [Streptomyces viridosporus]